jgi:hypothetical protein
MAIPFRRIPQTSLWTVKENFNLKRSGWWLLNNLKNIISFPRLASQQSKRESPGNRTPCKVRMSLYTTVRIQIFIIVMQSLWLCRWSYITNEHWNLIEQSFSPSKHSKGLNYSYVRSHLMLSSSYWRNFGSFSVFAFEHRFNLIFSYIRH